LILSGKKILVTRASHQAEEFVRLIEQSGGTAILFPTIEVVATDSWEQCDVAIDNLYMYNGLIFTSANGVEFFFQRFNERRCDRTTLTSKKIFVVGEKTGQTVERQGLMVTAMPEQFTAADLAKTIDHEDLHGKTFLFPRGNLGKDILQDTLKLLGANVDAVTVYRTRPPKQQDVEKIKRELFDGNIDVVTFMSPSTVKNFVALFSIDEQKLIDGKTRIAVIGPVTAAAVKETALEVDCIAKESTIESLLQSITTE
jgi:uroporphyrinogen-III synthase